jgi:hypothetical protein
MQSRIRNMRFRNPRRLTFLCFTVLAACLLCFATVAHGQYAETKLRASDGASSDYFGYRVAISGKTIVVGAWGDDSNKGAGYVYTPGQETKLTASDGAAYDYFGGSVGISGDTIVVGAYGDDSSKGAAYVYKFDGTTWQETKLTASDGTHYFGYSVAISGDTIVVGAWCGWNYIKGAAYVYKFDGTTWQETKLTASDGTAFDWFGFSVAVSGDIVVVGTPYKNSGGAAYVYKWNGTTSTWDETKLTASDRAVGDSFGWSVAVNEDTIVVGAYGDDSSKGAAYVYKWNDTTWQETKLTASDWAPSPPYPYGWFFGCSVAVSGDTVVVGAEQASVNGSHPGAAYVYKFDGTAWQEESKLTTSDGTAYSFGFGYSVAVSKNTIVVGNPYNMAKGYASGAAYVYRVTIRSVIDFFNSAVAHGDLVGIGPVPQAADGRLIALGNMLAQTEYYIDNSLIPEACEQLSDIYLKTDGNPLPPDFVSGDATSDLAAGIQVLSANLGCR